MTGCLDQFRVNIEHTFWTYGDTIYNPGGFTIPEDIVAHEEQHMRQQEAYEGGKDAWWKEYLINPRFRLEQEAEAYATQYKWLCQRIKDRNQRNKWCLRLADMLAGPLYQVAVTRSQARDMILILAGEKKLNVPTPQ